MWELRSETFGSHGLYQTFIRTCILIFLITAILTGFWALYFMKEFTIHFLGWIMKVKLSDESELSGLMDEESYTTFCDEQES